jgi:hypothetical protein
MARRARHLAGAARRARAIAQFVDSLETFRFGSAGISLIKDWILPIKSETAQFRGRKVCNRCHIGKKSSF